MPRDLVDNAIIFGRSGNDSMELLSPLADGEAAPRQSLGSSADNGSGDERVGEETGDTIARWSSVFTKVCGFSFRIVLDYNGSQISVFC